MLRIHFVCDSTQLPDLSFASLLPAQLSPRFCRHMFYCCPKHNTSELSCHSSFFKTAFHPDPVLQIAGHLCCKDAEHKCVLSKSLESLLKMF